MADGIMVKDVVHARVPSSNVRCDGEQRQAGGRGITAQMLNALALPTSKSAVSQLLLLPVIYATARSAGGVKV